MDGWFYIYNVLIDARYLHKCVNNSALKVYIIKNTQSI